MLALSIEELLEALDLSISQGNIWLEAIIYHVVCQDLKVDDLANYFQDGITSWFQVFQIVISSFVDVFTPGVFHLGMQLSVMHERI